MNKVLPLALTLALLQACGGGSDDTDVEPGTVGISGIASGITGEVTLRINGETETLTENGPFTLETRVFEDQSYSISIASSDQNLSCDIVNGTGTATGNITNLEVNCDGEAFTAYNLNDLAFSTEDPSVITFAFHLVDRYTGNAITDISKDNVTDYLEVLENDLPISPSESFLELDQFQDFNTEYVTVFVVDVSSSLQSEELELVKTSIINAVKDSNTGESKLDANQAVTVLSFDGNVITEIESSKDPEAIEEAVEGIAIRGNSTNLYGAIEAGAQAWDNVISLEKIQHGAMVLFTDGVDTSGLVSKNNALSAVEEKDVYFIAIGSETDTSELEDFTDSENIFAIDDFSQVAGTLASAIEDVKTYEQGLYILSYATPKRAGDHSLTIKGKDDFRCDTAVNEAEQNQMSNQGALEDCTDSVTYSFDADGFTDVEPTLKLSGTTVTLVPELDWQAKLRWTRETPNYDWNVKVCLGDIDYTLSEGESKATFTRTGNVLSIAYITVEETQTGQTAESYLILATSSSQFFHQSQIFLETTCNN